MGENFDMDASLGLPVDAPDQDTVRDSADDTDQNAPRSNSTPDPGDTKEVSGGGFCMRTGGMFGCCQATPKAGTLGANLWEVVPAGTP